MGTYFYSSETPTLFLSHSEEVLLILWTCFYQKAWLVLIIIIFPATCEKLRRNGKRTRREMTTKKCYAPSILCSSISQVYFHQQDGFWKSTSSTHFSIFIESQRLLRERCSCRVSLGTTLSNLGSSRWRGRGPFGRNDQDDDRRVSRETTEVSFKRPKLNDE